MNGFRRVLGVGVAADDEGISSVGDGGGDGVCVDGSEAGVSTVAGSA